MLSDAAGAAAGAAVGRRPHRRQVRRWRRLTGTLCRGCAQAQSLVPGLVPGEAHAYSSRREHRSYSSSPLTARLSAASATPAAGGVVLPPPPLPAACLPAESAGLHGSFRALPPLRYQHIRHPVRGECNGKPLLGTLFRADSVGYTCPARAPPSDASTKRAGSRRVQRGGRQGCRSEASQQWVAATVRGPWRLAVWEFLSQQGWQQGAAHKPAEERATFLETDPALAAAHLFSLLARNLKLISFAHVRALFICRHCRGGTERGVVCSIEFMYSQLIGRYKSLNSMAHVHALCRREGDRRRCNAGRNGGVMRSQLHMQHSAAAAAAAAAASGGIHHSPLQQYRPHQLAPLWRAPAVAPSPSTPCDTAASAFWHADRVATHASISA